MSFLDGSDSSDGEGVAISSKKGLHGIGSSSEAKDDDTLQVNEQFAKRFHKQKLDQDLQAAKHLQLGSDEGGSGSDSESETEDEDADMLTAALDLEIMKTINKIRSKDPDIYDTKKEWFTGDESGGRGDVKKAEKPMRYKDVVREQILQAETAEDAISSDDDSEAGNNDNTADRGGRRARRDFAYDEEQERLRKGFLGSIAEHEGGRDGDGASRSSAEDSEDEGDGLLQVRRKTPGELAEEEELLKKEAEKMAEAGDGGEDDIFLKDFVGNRRWLDPHAKETPSYDEILNAPHVEDSDDEQDVDRADDFESKYNFRFEEEGGGEIAMHSRNVPGSMRRKDDRRKRERESRKVRKAEERQRKEAELRRLKNLKREDIRRRLQAIQDMSGGALVDDGVGGGGKGVGEDAEALIEGDFDPQKWDAVTGKAFGDDYYEAEDADDGWKPGDDPLAGLGDLDQYGETDGVNTDGNDDSIVENKEDVEGGGGWEGGEGGGEDWDGEEDWEGEEGEQEEEEFEGMGVQKERLLDELYKLDYEDIIGDIPCRFKYTQVKANDFGLAPEEILLADDKDLNKYVPLKKLAPYRTDEPKLDARRRRRLRDEVKEREEAAEADMAALRAKKKRRGKRKGPSSSTSAVVSASNTETDAATTDAKDAAGEADGESGADSAVASGVEVELAGGKRRRRKKGQKKKKGATADAGGSGDGQDEADLVPRVTPIEMPLSSHRKDSGNGTRGRPTRAGDVEGEEGFAGDGDSGGPSKKKGKKRARLSEGEAQEEQPQDRQGAADSRAVATTREIENGGEVVRKKTRRGTSGRSGGGAAANVKEGKGERRSTKGKKSDRKAAQMGAASGLSKSRLASYGL